VPKQPNYQEILTSAEKAVAAVKDPELRRVAFQKILDELLSLGRPADAEPVAKAAKVATPIKRIVSSAKARKPGTRGYVSELINEGFFKKPKTISQLKAELENRGHHIPLTALSGPLQLFCQRRILRRNKVKSGNRSTFAYSNW
jgi:hypothetical protein